MFDIVFADWNIDGYKIIILTDCPHCDRVTRATADTDQLKTMNQLVRWDKMTDTCDKCGLEFTPDVSNYSVKDYIFEYNKQIRACWNADVSRGTGLKRTNETGKKWKSKKANWSKKDYNLMMWGY